MQFPTDWNRSPSLITAIRDYKLYTTYTWKSRRRVTINQRNHRTGDAATCARSRYVPLSWLTASVRKAESTDNIVERRATGIYAACDEIICIN